jgi:exonuclease SbcC
MRVRSITVEGFGPFKDAQTVDLTAFEADGLFLIAGDTGAGKSTILDAIAYALYGDAPRWDDVSAKARFRSDYCEPADLTRVVVEFETGSAEYRITRSPEYERPKARGAGTTTEKARALLEQRHGDSWVGLADRPSEVASRVAELIHLTKDEFLQVILLAQGRFHRFLLAPQDERLALLSKLFGAQRFKDYERRIADQRAALKTDADRAAIEVRSLLAGVEADEALGAVAPGEELAWVDTVIEAATARVRTYADALDAARQLERTALELRDVAERQQRRRQAMVAVADLTARDDEIDALRIRVAAAERAERVRPLIDAVAEADRAVRDATDVVDSARSGYLGSVRDDALADEVSRLDQQLGSLADAVADEERAQALRRESDAAAKALAAQEAQLATLVESIARLTAEREGLGVLAAQHAGRASQVESISRRRDAALEARESEAELQRARVDELAAARAYDEAAGHATSLLERHLRGQAAFLATRLQPGQPCEVCGSAEHPAPATTDDDPVTPDQVDQAREAADGLRPRHDAARQLVSSLTARAEKLRGLAGDVDADTLTSDLAAAQTALDESTAAAERLAEIEAELTGPDGLAAARDAHDAQIAAARQAVAEQTTQLAELLRTVEAARGSYPTVGERHEAITAERTATDSLSRALAHLTATRTTRLNAETQLSAKAEQEGFADLAAVTAALLEPQDLERGLSDVRSHEAAVERARGQLNAADLQGLPHLEIDIDAALEQFRAAQQATGDATVAHTTSVNALDTLQSQRMRLTALLDASADLVARHAVLERLSSTVNGKAPNSTGMSLQSYYVAAELEAVLAAANARLRTMTGGRYQLQHTERGILYANAKAGLELEVMDENTGKARDPHTLSGGEQFLASLALALGLAEVVTARAGGVELDTLFVDEGFGSLSPEFLEVAMSTLDSLKAGGRTVGVISHVESMKESIGAQLQVVREPGGWSTIRQPA